MRILPVFVIVLVSFLNVVAESELTFWQSTWMNQAPRFHNNFEEGKHHFSAIEGLNDANSTLCNALIDFMARCERI
jgi:hypothetical protein